MKKYIYKAKDIEGNVVEKSIWARSKVVAIERAKSNSWFIKVYVSSFKQII